MKYRYLILGSLLWACDSEVVEVPFDCSTTSISIETEVTAATCNEENGSVIASVIGGASPYTFTLGSETNELGSFPSLAGGSYSLEVTDANKCSATATVTITNADGVNFTDVQTTDAACGSSDGTIAATASGGEEPYSFQLSSVGSSSDGNYSQLAPGSYDLTVTDENGCSSTQEVSILSGISLDDDIMPIISTNCAISGCHGGSRSPNLIDAADVIENASRILARTSAGTMPPSGKLSDNLINQIECWVNDGTPSN